MAKTPTARTITLSNLTFAGGRYYSDPDNVPLDTPVLLIENAVRSPAGAITRIYPLSDTELAGLTSAGSASWYQSKAAAGIPWRLPLGARSGKYPYNIVLEGPVGADVVYHGRTELVPPFWEEIVWTNPTVGSHVFNVSWFDQDDQSCSVTFTLTVYAVDNTTHIGWVNPATGNDSNTGTRVSPWATIKGWYGANSSDATHRNKVIYYEDGGSGGINIGGVTGVSYSGASLQRITLNDNKPKVHVAVSSFNVHGNGAYWNFGGGQGWTFAGPFQHSGANVPEGGGANTRTQFFRGANTNYKYGFIGVEYTALGPDSLPSASSNSSFVEFSDTLSGVPSSTEGYFFPAVTINGVIGGVDGFGCIKNNNALGVLCTGWTIKNCTDLIVFHHKGGDIRRTEERGCLAIEANTTCQFRDIEYINDPVRREDNHYCWNNIKMLQTFTGGGTQLNGGGVDDYIRQGGWRNNERISFHWAEANSGEILFTRNARIHSGVHTDGVQDSGTITITAGSASPALEYTSATTTQFDATTNLLTGATRTAQLGLVGCEMTEA